MQLPLVSGFPINEPSCLPSKSWSLEAVVDGFADQRTTVSTEPRTYDRVSAYLATLASRRTQEAVFHRDGMCTVKQGRGRGTMLGGRGYSREFMVTVGVRAHMRVWGRSLQWDYGESPR
jgi:hypothetical protein